MNQPMHTAVLACLGDDLRQLHMGFFKGSWRTVQDGNQIDHHIVLLHALR